MTAGQGRQAAWAAGAVVLIAAALRLFALGGEGLWCDEAYTANMTDRPVMEMMHTLVKTDEAPPLFYILTRMATALFGNSEAALRGVPAAAGLLAVLLLLWSARRTGRNTDGWAAIFMALASFGVFYARQARSYTLIMLLTLAVILCCRELLRGGSRRTGPALAASAALLCMTHHVGVIILLTSLILWPLGRGRVTLARWLLWHSLPLALWAALWYFGRTQLHAHGQLNAWMGEYWQSHHLILAPLLSMAVFVPGALPADQLAVALASPGRISLLWSFLAAGLALVCLWAAFVRTPERRELATECAFLLLPLGAMLVASLVVTPVYVLGRTDAMAYPAFALLLGRGLARLPRRVATGALLYWLVLSLISLAPSYGRGERAGAKGQDRRLAAQLAREGLAPADWLIHTYLTAPSLEYYLKRSATDHQAAWFPATSGINPAGLRPAPLDSLPAFVEEAADLRRRMEAGLGPEGAAWILGLITPNATLGGTLTAAEVGYPLNILVYSLVGRTPLTPVAIYRQDWVSGRRVVLRLPRSQWVSYDELPPVLAPPGAGEAS